METETEEPKYVCSLCFTREKEKSLTFFIPSICLQKNGMQHSHRICEECWWSKFALEQVCHACPGCNKRVV